MNKSKIYINIYFYSYDFYFDQNCLLMKQIIIAQNNLWSGHVWRFFNLYRIVTLFYTKVVLFFSRSKIFLIYFDLLLLLCSRNYYVIIKKNIIHRFLFYIIFVYILYLSLSVKIVWVMYKVINLIKFY